MDTGKEKFNDAEVSSEGSVNHPQFYDPSKESVWTRLGVNFESFKRAPGVTAYVHLCCPKAHPNHALDRDRYVVGEKLSEAELQARMLETPMLQAKMKKRHLSMIAVGALIQRGNSWPISRVTRWKYWYRFICRKWIRFENSLSFIQINIPALINSLYRVAPQASSLAGS